MIEAIRAWWRRWFAAPDPVDSDDDYLGTLPVPRDLNVPSESTWGKYKDDYVKSTEELK